MKTNAIVRIVIYTLLVLVLIGILCAGLGVGKFVFHFGSENEILGEGSVSAADIKNLEIDWADGSIQIVTGDTDQISFTESGETGNDYRMAYSVRGDTLEINYSKSGITIGFISIPSKDLLITVPKDWVCQELELDGASMDIKLDGLTVDKLSIDGASNSIHFSGNVVSFSCDGASTEITMLCSGSPQNIDIDGAACELDLTLPEDCGFRAELDGLSCDFDSDFPYTNKDGCHIYGNQQCSIRVDGLSCDVTIRKSVT